MTDLTTIRDRLASATGPDRELDDLILRALGQVTVVNDTITGTEEINRLIENRPYVHPAPITASIDASLALGSRLGVDPLWMLGWAIEYCQQTKGTTVFDVVQGCLFALITALEQEQAND